MLFLSFQGTPLAKENGTLGGGGGEGGREDRGEGVWGCGGRKNERKGAHAVLLEWMEAYLESCWKVLSAAFCSCLCFLDGVITADRTLV